MNIGILTATDPALQKLHADGPSTKPAGPAGSEASKTEATPAPVKARPTRNVAPSIRFPSLRAALDARISADISSGMLRESDAVAVKRTLDAIDDRSRGIPGQGAPAQTKPVGYPSASGPQQIARAYLATIDRGTLIDRFG